VDGYAWNRNRKLSGSVDDHADHHADDYADDHADDYANDHANDHTDDYADDHANDYADDHADWLWRQQFKYRCSRWEWRTAAGLLFVIYKSFSIKEAL
jgi:hypothetical protein